MRILIRAAITLSLLLVAATTQADEGAVEINAACVPDGCMSGDAAGYPVEITSAGSYVLTSNLTVGSASTTAIDVSARHVTLDLNGFAVQGPVTCSDTPVTSCSPMGNGIGIDTSPSVAIHGGTVTGFGSHGIDTSTARVWDVLVDANGGDGIRGPDLFVRDSTVRRNGGAGISGAFTTGDLQVNRVQVLGNASDGVQVSEGVVLHSNITHNGDYGIMGAYSGDTSSGYGFNSLNGNVSGASWGVSAVLGCNVENGSAVCPP